VNETFYVYILASERNGTLYIGVTNDLVRRVYEHKQDVVPGFTKRYGIHALVYFEQFNEPAAAIQREKTMMFWPRQWKLNKIEEMNPTWRDLYEDVARP
jgi:putative endonuclease